MKAMGIGWLMQNAFYFRGEAFVGQRGAEAARLSPPIASALRLGLPVGGGTDAHRVMNYNPFVSLQWMLDGKTAGGMPMRGPEEIPTREEALRLYTLGSAWFSFDDDKRGSLTPGKLADLAVLTKDYLSVPVEEIGSHRVAAHHGRRPRGLMRAGGEGRLHGGAGGRRAPPIGERRDRVLLDHLVGQREQPVRNFEAERLGGLEVEHELELVDCMTGRSAASRP